MLFLAVLGLRCCMGFFLVAESGGYSPLVTLGLLVVVSPVLEHRLWGAWASVIAAQGLSSYSFQALGTGSVVVEHGLSCCEACGIFLDQGSNSCLLLWQVDSLPLSH